MPAVVRAPELPTKKELLTLTSRARVLFAVRCARRVQPLFELDHKDSIQKIDGALSAAERCAAGEASDVENTSNEVLIAADYSAQNRSKTGADVAISAALAASAAHGAQFRSPTADDAVAEAVANAAERSYDAVRNHSKRSANVVLELMRGDFNKLQMLANEHGWRDDSIINSDLLGPLWPPPRREPKWSKDGRERMAQFLEEPLSEDPEELAKAVRSLRDQRRKLAASERKARKRVSHLESEQLEANAKLVELAAEKSALEEQAGALEGKQDSLHSRIEDLERKRTELVEKYRELARDGKDMDNTIDKLRSENRQSQVRMESLSSAKDALEVRLRAVNDILSGHESEINRLKTECAKVEVEKENLAQQLDAKQELIGECETQIQALDQELNAISVDLGKARIATAKLEAELRSCNADRDELSRKLKEAEERASRIKLFGLVTTRRGTFLLNICLLVAVIILIITSLSEIAGRQQLLSIVEAEVDARTQFLADNNGNQSAPDQDRHLVKTLHSIRSSIATLIATGGTLPRDSLQEIRQRFRSEIELTRSALDSTTSTGSETERNDDKDLTYQQWGHDAWQLTRLLLVLCTTNSLLALAVMGSGALGSMADAMRRNWTESKITATETNQENGGRPEANSIEGTEQSEPERQTESDPVTPSSVESRIDELFNINAVFLGLVAGFITFLVLKSGRQMFLLQGDGATVPFNPFASALAGLVAGLFTDRAYRLLSVAVDEFYSRSVVVLRMGSQELKDKAK